jgi:fucose permease
METLKQILRILIAAPVGYFTLQYFNIESSFLRILYYLGIYIAVSLPLEIIWKKFEKKKTNLRM